MAPSGGGIRRKLEEYRKKRDFTRTREPSGDKPVAARSALRFVIQKHAASHLHYDFRLELDGVMKSWAVPKGPSLDPAVKRLAMEVEDHPISYNTFEGTIPKGEYGGGTVMLWDRGTYGTPESMDADAAAQLRRDYARGRMDLVMNGERLQGGWSLFRIRRGDDDSAKPQWLLVKKDDDTAEPGSDITAEHTTSIDTGRTMEQIASGRSRVWHSNRAGGDENGERPAAKKSAAKRATKSATKSVAKKTTATAAKKTETSVAKRATKKAAVKKGAARKSSSRKSASATAAPAEPAKRGGRPKGVPFTGMPKMPSIVPMKATIGTGVPEGEGWTFEPKYDGIRVIAYATSTAARVVTRNGNDKSAQFPEVITALRTLASKAKRPLVLDGEIVALAGDEVARFQDLQSRMHSTNSAFIETAQEGAPAALVVFDLLVDGDEVLIAEPWTERRKRLELRLRNRTSRALRLAESVPNDGETLLAKAGEEGWEGVIAKRMDSRYVPGNRSRDWLKLKIEHRQEFVIGGWTEPRNTREHIGALLLGYFDGDDFIYVGHTGGGFTRAGLKEMYERLAPLEVAKSPFVKAPKTNEKAHWTRPKVVVEVKFGEWTAEGKLRQPIFLGVRDDKPAREVGREPESVQDEKAGRVRKKAARGAAAALKKGTRKVATPAKKSASPSRVKPASRTSGKETIVSNAPVVQQLHEIEQDGGEGEIRIGSTKLRVTSLGREWFGKDGITKGDVMRYYANVGKLILPSLEDRPLVLKRTPEGMGGETFFQQKAPDTAPDVVRVETIEDKDGKKAERLAGGDLATLLYTVQIGCISTDPWMARIPDLDSPDITYLDLDPGPKAKFDRIVQVAHWVKEELDTLGLVAALKTSGSRGLHVGIPLPADATWETALMLAQVIATRVATKHPKEATVERSVAARPAGAVYVDYLQNVRGKSVAGAYAVRAKPGATVSTPLDWSELTDDLDPHDFTVRTAPSRFAKVGDLWKAGLRKRNTAAALRALAGGRR